MTGGFLVVDGARANTIPALSYAPGTAIEFVATFGAEAYQNAGFGAGSDLTPGEIFNATPAAIFSTGSGGTQVIARVSTSGAGNQDTGLGAGLIGTSHTYKIVWLADRFEFYVDNVLLHTQATAVAGPMRIAVSDYALGGPTLSADWLHVAKFATPGTFTSRVFDGTVNTATWGTLSWTADSPAGTTMAMSARTGNTTPPTGAWVPLSASGTGVGATNRYLQYRAVLSTTNTVSTPVLRRVDVTYDTTVPDTAPPTIVSRTPASGATGVPVGTTVVAQFSEVVNAATVTTSTFRIRAAGAPSDVAATVVPSGNIATLTPSSALSIGVTYTVTVSGTVADLSGNPLGSDVVWTFTTATPSFTDTTVANFSAASASTCVAGSYESGGDVILAPSFGSGFDGAALPTGWQSTPWTGGAGTVSGGLLTVDGARVDSGAALYPVGRALEFVATFGAETYQNAGLGLDLAAGTESWAMFGTGSTTNALYAQTNDGAGAIDVLIPGSWIGSPHRYRVERDASEVRFYIDGTLLHTAPITISASLRPLFSDYQSGGSTLAVDWLRITPFTSPCTLDSRVFDAGQPVTWSGLSWTADVPTGTALAMSARSGSTSVPDGTWTAFTPVLVPGATNAGVGRYAQYRAALSATDLTRTPALRDVTLSSSAPPSYTLTVTLPTNGTITGTGITCGTGGSDCTQTYGYGTVVALTATPGTGYNFSGWTDACTGTGACSVTMTAARTVGATFTIQQYTLTVTAPTNGTITGTGITCGTGGVDCTEIYSYGTVVPLTATPATGYDFGGWTGACTGTGACAPS